MLGALVVKQLPLPTGNKVEMVPAEAITKVLGTIVT